MMSFMKQLLALLTIAVLLTGCAGLEVIPLTPNDYTKDRCAQKGLRYYMPAPYLLVIQLPKATQEQKKDDQTKGTNTISASSTPSGANNTSFFAETPTYKVKLIYLPDLSQPMALQVKSGLFGTTTFKPMLQDGWMLTSFDSKMDAKGTEMLHELLSPVTGAAGGLAKALGFGQVVEGEFQAATSLAPGLYKFNYNENGMLVGLEKVTDFREIKTYTPPNKRK